MRSEPWPLSIELWPLSRFVEYQWNPRNNDAAVDRMCASIREFGFKIPCVVRSNGEVVDGHLRLKAARKLGLKEIPVILCNEWTPKQVKAFRVLVNRSATWAGWDPEWLALELQELEQAKVDLSLTGFDPAELDELLKSGPAIADMAESVPAAPEAPVSQAGDLWRLGPHRVLCGDATHSHTVARLLGGRQVRLLVTELRDRSVTVGAPPESVEVAYVWHDSRFTREVLDGLLRMGFGDHEQIIWNRGGFSQAKACATTLPNATARRTRGHYRVQHEPCWYVRKKSAPWFGKAGEDSTMWASPNPAQKPVELMRKPIVNHLRRGEVVYDPFLGRGATLAAAELTKRVCYGMELDPRYVDVAVRRWQTLTGRQATHDIGGVSFEEVTRGRGSARMCREEANGGE